MRAAHPEVFVRGGIMERGNYSAAAGFGYEAGKQGVFGLIGKKLGVGSSSNGHVGKSDWQKHKGNLYKQ